ncbi:hypothetical protein K8R33_01780 [archaeon]|nr:hypothetical protein [archaeon]
MRKLRKVVRNKILERELWRQGFEIPGFSMAERPIKINEMGLNPYLRKTDSEQAPRYTRLIIYTYDLPESDSAWIGNRKDFEGRSLEPPLKQEEVDEIAERYNVKSPLFPGGVYAGLRLQDYGFKVDLTNKPFVARENLRNLILAYDTAIELGKDKYKQHMAELERLASEKTTSEEF